MSINYNFLSLFCDLSRLGPIQRLEQSYNIAHRSQQHISSPQPISSICAVGIGPIDHFLIWGYPFSLRKPPPCLKKGVSSCRNLRIMLLTASLIALCPRSTFPGSMRIADPPLPSRGCGSTNFFRRFHSGRVGFTQICALHIGPA